MMADMKVIRKSINLDEMDLCEVVCVGRLISQNSDGLVCFRGLECFNYHSTIDITLRQCISISASIKIINNE